MTYVPNQSFEISSFSELENVTTQNFIEGAATYGLIPANFRTFSANGGAATTEGRLFKCSTGTSQGGYGAIQSFRSIPHRIGRGVKERISGYFSGGAANSEQGIGLISIGEEMSFGYSGADFGVWHRYGGLSEVRTITVTGAAGADTDLTLTLNGTAYTIPITTGTVEHNAYEIAAWLNENQSVWGADQLDDTVIINALSDGAKGGTYSFSHATATGTIAQNTEGVTKTSDFIVQDDWNQNTLQSESFTLDPTKGNIYQISYQNMGFGEVTYSVLDPESSRFIDVHKIKWPNTTTTIGIPNPSLRAGWYCFNTTNTTNLDVYVSSVAVAVEGASNKTRNSRAFSATQQITTTNETAVMTIRNRRTYNGYNNQVEIEPLFVGVSNETNRNATINVRATNNVGIEQDFTNSGTNLVSDVDTTAINFTSGRLLASKPLSPLGFSEIDLEKLQLSQSPTLNLIITVTRTATGGSNQNFTGTYTWYEDL